MDSRVVGENKGTSKVFLQFADAISSVASFINRYLLFTPSLTPGFADMDGLGTLSMHASSVSQPMNVVDSPPTLRHPPLRR